MTPKELSTDLTDALHSVDNDELPVVDPTNGQIYVLVKRETLDEAKAALHLQRNVDAIQQGIEAANEGRMRPAKEALPELKQELRSRYGQ
jgi:hypothetical protein